MGFRFRKSVKIIPGVRLNFGMKSTSVSLGGKGYRYTVSSTGRKTRTVSVPGTGVSYSETVGNKAHSNAPAPQRKTLSPKIYKTGGILLLVLAALTLLVLAVPVLTFSPAGLLFVLLAAIEFWCGLCYVKKSKGQSQIEKAGD